jgi:hypothetical protein
MPAIPPSLPPALPTQVRVQVCMCVSLQQRAARSESVSCPAMGGEEWQVEGGQTILRDFV